MPWLSRHLGSDHTVFTIVTLSLKPDTEAQRFSTAHELTEESERAGFFIGLEHAQQLTS
jgi:hypothetical protein